MVVRFNGGAQAGHTVTIHDKKHVFGHFSSNSFLDNATTYLSKFFVINPILFLKEKKALNNLGVNPKVIVNESCYITTPFDMVLNQWVEFKRSKNCHGSCGLGFGETINRCETKEYGLYVYDLGNMDYVKKQLINIKNNYFKNRLKELELDSFLNDENNEWILNDNTINKYINDLQEFISMITISKEKIIPLEIQQEIIFEGAQGLLLDQKIGCFPYVTRSNTGLKNIIELSDNLEELDVYYITRCYTTRHGAGPLSNELKNKPYENIIDETNIPNQFQGSLRYSYLDLDILKDTIKKDINSVIIPTKLKVNFNLGISCLDQTNEVYFYENKELKKLSTKKFIQHMQLVFDMTIFGSYGPTRKTIKKYKKYSFIIKNLSSTA